MADQNAVKIYLKEEVTYGTSPGGNFDEMRFTSEGFRTDDNRIQSQEIDADRGARASHRVARSAVGSLNGELSLTAPAEPPTGYDILVEAGMHQDWQDPADVAGSGLDLDISGAAGDAFTVTDGGASSPFTNVVPGQWLRLSGYSSPNTDGTIYAYVTSKTDANTIVCTGCTNTGAAVQDESGVLSITVEGSYIRPGTSATKKSYAVEKARTDLATPNYTMCLGETGAALTMGINSEGFINISVTFQGKIADTTTSSGAGTPTAKWTQDPVNASAHVPLRFVGAFGNSKVRSSTVTNGARVTGFDFTLDNVADRDPEVGDGLSGPGSIRIGNPTISGNFTYYVEDDELLVDSEGNTATKFAFLIDDGTTAWMLTFPKVILGAIDDSATTSDGALTGSVSWSGESVDVDPGAGVTNVPIQIDRF